MGVPPAAMARSSRPDECRDRFRGEEPKLLERLWCSSRSAPLSSTQLLCCNDGDRGLPPSSGDSCLELFPDDVDRRRRLPPPF